MGLSESMRNKLQAKVFASGKLASDATLYTKSSAAYDEYGAEINVSQTSSSVRAVPYNLIGGRVNYQPFGDLAEGESETETELSTLKIGKKVLTFCPSHRIDRNLFLFFFLGIQLLPSL